MTVLQIIDILENNYKEISLIDHINEWQKWSMADSTIYSLCQVRNDFHNLVIQALVQQAQEGEDLPNKRVDEIYISYKENEINIQKAFEINEESETHLIYNDLVTIDIDMDWVS